jgi:transposase
MGGLGDLRVEDSTQRCDKGVGCRIASRVGGADLELVDAAGIQWEYLPQELGFGPGMTWWRRLAAWNEAGVWGPLHVVLLEKLRSKDKPDWPLAVIDSSHVRAARRGPKAVPARSTTHGRAASTTSSSTGTASRSQCHRPAATPPLTNRRRARSSFATAKLAAPR